MARDSQGEVAAGVKHKIGRLLNTRSDDEWAALILSKWQDNISSIFEVGNLLESMRQEKGGKKFAQIVRDKLKFSKSMCSKLTSIADDEKLREVSHAKLLPPSWDTLYELSLLTAEQFQTGIDTGVIHSGMERKDVKSLRPPKPKKKPSTRVLSAEEWCDEIIIKITSAVASVAPDERGKILSEIRETLNQLEREHNDAA